MPSLRERHETLSQAVLLAAVGGFLDAFTFIRFQVFANAQSGNVVLFAVDAASANWRAALLRLAPIGAFVVGVLVVETLARPAARRAVRRPLRVVLSAEIVGLLIVAALPDRTAQLVITVTVSFVAAVQFSTFRMVAGQVYTTLLTSGNLRTAVVHLFQWMVDRDPTARTNGARFGAVIISFAAGATLGALITRGIGNRAAVVPAVLLVGVLFLAVTETRRLERGRGTVGRRPPTEPVPPPPSSTGG